VGPAARRKRHDKDPVSIATCCSPDSGRPSAMSSKVGPPVAHPVADEVTSGSRRRVRLPWLITYATIWSGIRRSESAAQHDYHRVTAVTHGCAGRGGRELNGAAQTPEKPTLEIRLSRDSEMLDASLSKVLQ
jgi:hypothetical protein